MSGSHSTPSGIVYEEWIPVRERLPEQTGRYITLVTALLDNERIIRIQHYAPSEHPEISGWQYARTTHWRPQGY